MARVQITRVEELDRGKPGLRQAVDFALDAMRPLEWIQATLREKFGESIPLSTLSSYKQRRWLQHKLRIEEIKNHAVAIMELLESHGVSDVRRAMLFERVQAAMDAGAALDPEFMLREERRWAELDFNNRKLETRNAQLEAQNERTKEAVEEAEHKLGKGESLTAEDIARIRERVFGLAAEEKA